MSDHDAWLLLVSSISGENKTARQRIWRALKASGAGTLRDGVYILPNGQAARLVFREQADDVVAAGGTAHLLAVDSQDAAQEREFQALFDRGAEYSELMHRLDTLKTRMKRFDEVEARRELAMARRDAAALVAIDFFPGAPRQQIEHVLADLDAAYNARFAPDEPHATRGSVPKRERKDYLGRTWATRKRPWVDRIASAWLIRRFIDPKAKFLWLKNPRACPKRALGFDFDGAEFRHIGTRVTFEVLAASFGLEHDPAIARIGRLVHYLDVGGVAVAEAAGFAAILGGARARQASDDKLLQSMTAVLDALHATYQDVPGAKP